VALLASVLEPVLDLDDSPRGRQRAADVRDLIDQVLAEMSREADLSHAWLQVASAPELVDSEEPDAPESYRYDVLAILDYSLRAALLDDPRWAPQGLARFEDSLYFLQQATGAMDSDLARELIGQIASSIESEGGALATDAPPVEGARAAVRDLVAFTR
jgi:hypothetical protein